MRVLWLSLKYLLFRNISVSVIIAGIKCISVYVSCKVFYSKCGKKCRIIAINFCLCSACLRQLKVCIALTYFLFLFRFNLVQAQSSTSPPPAPSLLSAWPFSWPCYGWLPVWLAWPLSPSCLITIIFLTLQWLTSPLVTNEPSLAQAIKRRHDICH